MSKYDATKQLKCSFCGKPQDQVRRLVAGPNVYICDECIELCQDIIREEFSNAMDDVDRRADRFELPKPKEIASNPSDNVIDRTDAKKGVGCCGI
jgi:ATP-dependent Clp protease ATP-binding subunit ClpX